MRVPRDLDTDNDFGSTGEALHQQRTMPTTPKKLSARMRSLLHFLGADPEGAVFLKHFRNLDFSPEAGNCLLNCMVQQKRAGGELIHGWMIWEDRENDFCEAEHHVIWRDGNVLRDLTPRIDGEKRVLFVPDPKYEARFDRSTTPPITFTFDNARLVRGGVYYRPQTKAVRFTVVSRLPAMLDELSSRASS